MAGRRSLAAVAAVALIATACGGVPATDLPPGAPERGYVATADLFTALAPDVADANGVASFRSRVDWESEHEIVYQWQRDAPYRAVDSNAVVAISDAVADGWYDVACYGARTVGGATPAAGDLGWGEASDCVRGEMVGEPTFCCRARRGRHVFWVTGVGWEPADDAAIAAAVAPTLEAFGRWDPFAPDP